MKANRSRILISWAFFLALLLIGTSSAGAVTYTYQGPVFSVSYSCYIYPDSGAVCSVPSPSEIAMSVSLFDDIPVGATGTFNTATFLPSSFGSMPASGFITLANGIVTDWSFAACEGNSHINECSSTSLGGDSYSLGVSFPGQFSEQASGSGPSSISGWSEYPGPTPLPATLPLFASGLAALGLFGWRRKKKTAAILATNKKIVH